MVSRRGDFLPKRVLCKLVVGLPRTKTSTWPLFYVGFARHLDVEEYAAHYRGIRQQIEANTGDFVVLMDLRRVRAEDFGGAQRRAAAGGLSEIAQFNSRLRAQAFVVGDRTTRGLVASYLWVTQRPYPTRVLMDIADAVDWLQSFVSLPQASKIELARLAVAD